VQRHYFDHNATTPVSPEVLEAMLPVMTEVFGNPSSIHHYGQAARARLDHARRQVAALLNCSDSEVVFTSGGTESDNLAILGAGAGGHVVTTTIEHPAVLGSADQLPVTRVPVDRSGIVDPDAIRKAIRPDTKLISVMHINNELGTVQPVEEIGRIAREAGVAFHSDGIQAAGKVPIDVRAIHADLYSISGHKIYAPKGTGALFIRKGVELRPQMHGGSHESHLRAGTQNVAGAVALGAAAQWIISMQPRSGPLSPSFATGSNTAFSPVSPTPTRSRICANWRQPMPENTLGADTIAVAMSGGVDSSVVAGMLRARGENVVGLTMQLWNQRRLPELVPEGGATGRCCSLDDVYDARHVAQHSGHSLLRRELSRSASKRRW
jgi:hypothetical protein